MALAKNLSRKRKLSQQKRSFISTKKKCSRRKNALKNPSWAERKEIISQLS